MNIKDQNLIILIQRMLGYLGWAVQDPVLKRFSLIRSEVKKFSELIKNSLKNNAELRLSEDESELTRKVLQYFKNEERRNPGNLHTLTGFDPIYLDALFKLFI